MAKRPREGTEVREISKDQITHGFLDYGYKFAFYRRHHGKSLKGFKPDSDTHIQATLSGEAEGGEKAGKKQDVQRPLERRPPVWPGTEHQAGWKEVRLEMWANARLPRLPCAAGGLPAGLTSSGLRNLNSLALGLVSGVRVLHSPPQTARTQPVE